MGVIMRAIRWVLDGGVDAARIAEVHELATENTSLRKLLEAAGSTRDEMKGQLEAERTLTRKLRLGRDVYVGHTGFVDRKFRTALRVITADPANMREVLVEEAKNYESGHGRATAWEQAMEAGYRDAQDERACRDCVAYVGQQCHAFCGPIRAGALKTCDLWTSTVSPPKQGVGHAALATRAAPRPKKPAKGGAR